MKLRKSLVVMGVVRAKFRVVIARECDGTSKQPTSSSDRNYNK